ncbi:MAG TPA: hypothetical protein VFO63_10465, partial [Blastocatellia bacterium]|nr:hypothetical protein [Blastocatellia bacterium]
MKKAVLTILIMFICGLFTGSPRAAQETVRGDWLAEYYTRSRSKSSSGPRVQLTIKVGSDSSGHRFNSSFGVPLSELRGLSLSETNLDIPQARFEIQRDAGTFYFEGIFRNGKGIGEFRFEPSSDYIAGMRSLGYTDLSNKHFELAMFDVSRSFIQEMTGLGYTNQSLNRLVEFRIHGVSPDYVKTLRAAG